MPRFSDFGLISEGMDKGELNRQAVETGRIGLENLQRENETQAAVRNAAIQGAKSGQGSTGTFDDMARAAESRGDVQTAFKLRQAGAQLEEEGIKNVVHKALIDPRPGLRPDLAEEFNRFGTRRDMPNDVELDDKGNLWATDPKTGQRGSINIGVAAERLGMVKPFEKDLPAGSTYIRGNPVTGATTQITAPKYGATRTGTVYSETTGATGGTPSSTQTVIHVERTVDGEKKTYAYDTAQNKWIGGPPPGENGAPPEAASGAGVRRNLPVLKAVDESVSKIPGAVNKMDLSDPLHPYYEWTPKGQAYATRAQRLYLANPNLPPELIRDIVSAPDLQARVVNGEEAELKYKGKVYKLGESGGTPAPTQQPSAPAAPVAAPSAPAAVPAQPTPKPTPKKEEPKPKPKPQEAKDDDIPQVVEPKGSASSPKERYQSRVAAELAKQKAAREAKAANKPAETFRAIASSPTMSRDDIPLIQEAIDSGKLTSAEELKARRMLSLLKPQTAGR